MAFNTGNPLGSSSPKDLSDNAHNLDIAMNGTALSFTDRFGVRRYSIARLNTLIATAIAEVDPTVAAAKTAVNSTRDAANAEMLQTAADLGGDLNNKYYSGPTAYEDMLADPQSRDAVVGIVDGNADHSKDGWWVWDLASNDWVYAENQQVSERSLEKTIAQISSAREGLTVCDNQGFRLFEVLKSGNFGTFKNSLSEKGVQTPAFDLVNAGVGQSLLVQDIHGFVLKDLLMSTAPGSGGDSVSSGLAERNAVNLAASSAVLGEFNTEIQRPTAKYNHCLAYGQSLITGNETWPALSTSAYGGNLMYGDSTRPASRDAAVFTPLGTSTLRPLKAVVQSSSGASILTDAEVAALAAGSQNQGEGPEVGMLNFARKQFLQYHGLALDSSRLFVTSSPGVSGCTIEQLSKGASPDIYQRLVQATQAVKDIATAEGATYCIPAIFWLQGEYNYVPDYGGDTTKDGYKAKLLAQANIWKAELAQGISGQSAPPAIITYQTGAAFTRDTNDLSIGMAQWELSKEQANWYLAAPYYPYTDKGGHLDSNGSRWLGAQLGKVFHRVVTLGQGWKPLSPRGMTISGKEILIDFHVPCPPLAWDKPYVSLVATEYVDKGFRVKDSSSTLLIKSVEIVTETIVRIELLNTPTSTVTVQYATLAGSGGNGCLRDSDPTVSTDRYQYTAGSGQYPAANIAALVGRPYPLQNWCIAFSLQPETI